MTALHCPTCGSPVKVSGRTTKYYVPVPSPAVARLYEAAVAVCREDGVIFCESNPRLKRLEAALAAVEAEFGKEARHE
jgi:hypothetical protein